MAANKKKATARHTEDTPVKSFLDMLFNILSFLSDKLLTEGNTVAALDELYIWLSNPTAIEYIRNCLKRVRKKESAMLLASQNLEASYAVLQQAMSLSLLDYIK